MVRMTEDGQGIETPKAVDPRMLLATWANESDEWVRLLVSEVLSTGRPVDQASVDRAYELFRQEKALDERKSRLTPLLVFPLSWPKWWLEPSSRFFRLSMTSKSTPWFGGGPVCWAIRPLWLARMPPPGRPRQPMTPGRWPGACVVPIRSMRRWRCMNRNGLPSVGRCWLVPVRLAAALRCATLGVVMTPTSSLGFGLRETS